MTALAIHGVPTLVTGAQHVAITPFTISATGGTGPYNFTAIGLPAGVSINITTGVVSGTPTESGNFDVQFEAGDTIPAIVMANSQFAIVAEIIIIPSKAFSVPSPQFLVVGTPMTAVGLTVNESIFTDPITYSASWLPPGLSIDSATGLISGTPTVYVGAQTIFLYAVDAHGNRFQGVLEIEIFPAVNGADASQEREQSGMLLFMQRPRCLGVTGELPTTDPGALVLQAVAAMALAYPA